MREIIQEEMFADVSISKIKRVKSILMQRMYDATKGEYALVFGY
jgi:alpha-galactosidase